MLHDVPESLVLTVLHSLKVLIQNIVFLQDDPPNPNHGLLEDTDSMGGLDVNFVEDYLTFHPME